MAKHLLKTLPILFFLAGLLFPINTVQAAMCSGAACSGLYADSSCGATGIGLPKTYNYAYIENRQSTIYCLAQWTRVTNKNPSSRWTAASIRYGGAYYDYHQSTQSGAAIPLNYAVFTPMVGNDSGVNSINALSCGNTSTTQLGLPLGGTTPATNPMCSGVW